jgi:hypothetical protein
MRDRVYFIIGGWVAALGKSDGKGGKGQEGKKEYVPGDT